MTDNLLIIGASTRAAAQSAVRAGLSPICIDLFGDMDLRAVARVVTVADYAAVPAAVDELPVCPWMYTGGFENHPRLIAKIANRRPLLGNGPDVLAKVRDPWWIETTLRNAGQPALEVWPAGSTTPPADGTWLRKPVRGVGGRAIAVWDSTAAPLTERSYFQRRVIGQPYSAIFVAGPERTTLIGVTRQLVGLSEVHAATFAWCGSVVPVTLPAAAVDTMQRAGELLASKGGMCGLFGLDFVVADETPWLTEVNPRYTGAMELFDFLLRESLVGRHVEVCQTSIEIGMSSPRPLEGGGVGGGGGSWTTVSALDIQQRSAPPSPTLPPPGGNGEGQLAGGFVSCLGKVVLFADTDLVAPDAAGLLAGRTDDSYPPVADVPPAGQPIAPGHPICTLFASESTADSCVTKLIERAGWFRQNCVLHRVR